MYIELLGLSGVKIQSNDTTILLAPPNTDSGLRNIRLKTDILVATDPESKLNVAPNKEKIFSIIGPGEYESQGIFFYCLPNPADGTINSLLSSITLEGVTVTHLSWLNRALTSAEMELFEGTDVLILPIGGKDVLSTKAASELVNTIEPRIVIPMHFAKIGLKTKYDDATAFLKEMGAKTEAQERIKIIKKDLPQETTEVVYLLG